MSPALAELELAILSSRQGKLGLYLFLGIGCALHLDLLLLRQLTLKVEKLWVRVWVFGAKLESCVCRIFTHLGGSLLECVALKNSLAIRNSVLRLGCNWKHKFVLLGLISEGLGLE